MPPLQFTQHVEGGLPVIIQHYNISLIYKLQQIMTGKKKIEKKFEKNAGKPKLSTWHVKVPRNANYNESFKTFEKIPCITIIEMMKFKDLKISPSGQLVKEINKKNLEEFIKTGIVLL